MLNCRGGKNLRDCLFGKGLVVGIIIILMLLIPSTISISASKIQDENNNKEEIVYELWIFRAKINDLREEIIDDILYYTFHAITFKAIVFHYISPLYFGFQRLNEENIETGFPKNLFKGFINENFVIGIVSGFV